jgi:archaellum biogenesis ATPase FlaH
VKETEYKDCKDANDILRKYGPEQLRKCVSSAVYVQNDALINIVDVERIDLDKIEKFKTGIVEIDSLIGGIPLEGTTVITGKSGEGKSTFASQVLAKAIDAGYKCMAYSGELPNGMFKEWLYLQLAGKNNIYMLENSPRISVDVESKIDAWIDEKLWLYDVDALFKRSENELSGLLEIIEQAILQYECRVILIDNLMTALDIVDPENALYNKYEAQAHFVRKLAELGRNYKVAVILVAHKRKNGNSSDANDEISGSSEITNYSTMIINYSKYTASEIANGNKATDRKMSVTKERLKGGSASSFNVTFEPNSKRIYSTASNMLGYKFGWENGGTQATGWSEVGNIELPFS